MPMFSAIRKGLASNLHFIGVVLFFILHGYARNYPLIPVGSILLLLLEVLAGGFVVYWMSRKIFGSPAKAGLFTSFVLTIYLFFVPFQDFFASYRFSAPFARTSWFFPGCVIAIVIAGIWLKKSHRKFLKSSGFISTLVAIYVVVECGIIIGKIFFLPAHNNNNLDKYQLTVCDTCKKIPVYLIVTDEHIGLEAEKQYLDYFDTSFAAFLHSEDFHLVQRARSNYALTIFSVSSFLNMRYHDNDMKPLVTSNHFAYTRAQEAIRENAVCNYFEKEGYRIINNSIFNLKNAPAGYASNLPAAIGLVTGQTMYYPVSKNLFRALDHHFHIPWLAHKLEDEIVDGNETMMARTLTEAKKYSTQPTFTYVHLLMPHAPFAFDSTGHRVYGEPLERGPYFQYLLYTDKRLARFIQQLKQATRGQAAIILMGDHAARIWLKQSLEEPFMPLSAIYLPQGNYEGWYPGISHVNQFRVLFNTLFHQSMPMLPDSSSWGQ